MSIKTHKCHLPIAFVQQKWVSLLTNIIEETNTAKPVLLRGHLLGQRKSGCIRQVTSWKRFHSCERGRGVKVQNWPHIILKNNARHRIKTIY
jgi:hypothetical protein